MKPATPNWHIAQRNLRSSPYIASVSGVLAVVLALWTPLYISYLVLAAGVGCIGFFIQWLGVRRRTHLGPISTILMVWALLLGRAFWLPDDADRATFALCVGQFVSVFSFAFAALHLLFRKGLMRDLETYAV